MEYKWSPDPDVIARERVKELLSPDFIAQARQRYQGDPYNQGDIKPKPTAEELKQDRDMRKEDYIDDGTLDEQGQPNKLQMIQDGADAIYKLLQIVPALGGFHQLQMSNLDQDSPMWPNLEPIGVDVPRYIDDEEYGIPVDADHPDIGRLHHDNKAGNVDEVWSDINPQGVNYNIPTDKLLQNLQKLKLQLKEASRGNADLMIANAGDDIIKTLPRGGYYRNSHRDALESGDLTEDKLLKTLKRAVPHLLEGV